MAILHTLPFAPYDALEYSNATHLGSAHFDGNNDYLMAPSGSVDLGSDDFCVEFGFFIHSKSSH